MADSVYILQLCGDDWDGYDLCFAGASPEACQRALVAYIRDTWDEDELDTLFSDGVDDEFRYQYEIPDRPWREWDEGTFKDVWCILNDYGDKTEKLTVAQATALEVMREATERARHNEEG